MRFVLLQLKWPYALVVDTESLLTARSRCAPWHAAMRRIQGFATVVWKTQPVQHLRMDMPLAALYAARLCG